MRNNLTTNPADVAARTKPSWRWPDSSPMMGGSSGYPILFQIVEMVRCHAYVASMSSVHQQVQRYGPGVSVLTAKQITEGVMSWILPFWFHLPADELLLLAMLYKRMKELGYSIQRSFLLLSMVYPAVDLNKIDSSRQDCNCIESTINKEGQCMKFEVGSNIKSKEQALQENNSPPLVFLCGSRGTDILDDGSRVMT